MASITNLMNSNYNTSSIYGTRNVLSGLASGMDTETMIENAVSGIKRKIQSLYQKRTKVEWQQEAYRSIIDKAVNLNTKYTSYTSKTNLLSSSFFTNAVLTTVNGTYANKVSASGKTSSDIKINAVKQLATAATYSVSGSAAFGGDISTVMGGSVVDLSGDMKVSAISGSLTLKYGGANGTKFDLSFDELENIDDVVIYNEDGTVKEDATSAEKLAQAIKDKLSEQTWTRTKNGVQESLTGDKVIDVQVDDDGNITFSDKLNEGSSVSISSAIGDIKDTLGVSTDSEESTLKVGDTDLTKKVDTREALSGKTLTLNLNGISKSISMDDVLSKIDDDSDEDINTQFMNALQDEINNTFGKGKVEVSRDADSGKLSFNAMENGSTLVLSGTAVKALGFESGDSNYINTAKKLGDLLGKDVFNTSNRLAAVGEVTEKTNSDGAYYVDSKGNKVELAEDGNYYRIDSDGNAIYDFKINGVSINVTEDTTLESLMNSINSNADAGVKVSYSKLTNEFKFTATETGSNSRIDFGGLAAEVFGPSGSSNDKFAEKYGIDLGENDEKYVEFQTSGGKVGFAVTSDMTVEDIIGKINHHFSNFTDQDISASYDERSGQIVMADKNGTLDYTVAVGDSDASALQTVTYKPSASYTAGKDAVMDVEVNGVRFENLTRSSNSFDIDGMTINVKDTFGVDENGELLSVDKDGNEIEAITFTTVTDTDKIIDAIRSFVNDYNEMVTELKGAYSTQPAYKSGTTRYEPLTAEEEEGYTESQLAAHNEKAKQGILFGDTTLSSMYSKLLNAIAPGGVDGQTLREIGIGTSYENGLTTISLNEDKLRTALESDPDKVKNAFTKTTEGGSSSNGLMQTMQNTLNAYVRTVGEPKGALITRAGSVKAPTSLNNNSLNTQISNIDNQIQRWQDKMSSQIDRYTKQFSKLEQLVAAMNSQASALAGLMGGAEGYY